ncbi:DUF362 domain-containing protein [Chloroflexota bacterium]
MLYIDSDRCVGCGACADVCPRGAISVSNNVAVIDHKLCNRCGNCAEMCPAGAIRTDRPVEAHSGKGGGRMRGRGWFSASGRGRGNPYPFCRFIPGYPDDGGRTVPGPRLRKCRLTIQPTHLSVVNKFSPRK